MSRAVVFSSSLFFRLAMMTRAPFCTKAWAAISPSPVAPPVIRQTWSLKLKRFDTARFAESAV